MESTIYKKIKALADEFDKTLLATDPRLRGSVHIVYDDGSNFFFNNAFALKYEYKRSPEEIARWMTDDTELWYCVFTEHHGVNIYAADDLLSIRSFTENYREFADLPV